MVHSLYRSRIVVMLCDSWYVSGCAARLSIVASAGIRLDEGLVVGGGGQGAERQRLLSPVAARSKGEVKGATTEVAYYIL
jgi:hypothetical protein